MGEMTYLPPFEVSREAINMIADISRLIERYSIRLEKPDALRLRKANRIKTIHSSLAIEGNTLSEDEVRDIVNGKIVVAPLRQITEVRNAIQAYELYPMLDAFNEDDLLKAHSVMMQSLVGQAGCYRSGGVGVFGEKGLVHLAPASERVPILMKGLFEWLRNSKDHLLIRSCVFHYEFEFIHPFIDGNGRIGRLWQSLILGKLHPLFEYLPIENMVYANQQKYYDALTRSSAIGQSGPFIDFMLGEILHTLEVHKDIGKDIVEDVAEIEAQFSSLFGEKFGIKFHIKFGINDKKLLVLINNNPHLTLDELSVRMGITTRGVEKQIKRLKEHGVIERQGSKKSGKWVILK